MESKSIEFSSAVVCYLGHKIENSPRQSILRLKLLMGEVYADANIQRLQELLKSLNEIQVDWSTTTLKEGAYKARLEIAKKYPDLEGNALDALEWTYSWWWK
jgi:hypothetical protein